MIISEFLLKLGALQDEARRQFPDCVGVRFYLRNEDDNLFLIGNGGFFEDRLIVDSYPESGKRRKNFTLLPDENVDFDGKTLTFDDMSFRLEVAVTFAADKFKI